MKPLGRAIGREKPQDPILRLARDMDPKRWEGCGRDRLGNEILSQHMAP